MFLCFEVTQPSTGTVEDHETNPIVHIKHPEETHGAWGIIAHMSGPTNGGVSYVPGMGYHSGLIIGRSKIEVEWPDIATLIFA